MIRRVQRKGEERQTGGLADGGAELRDVRRQIGRGLRHAVLHVHFIRVDVGVHVECHGQRHGVVVAVGRLHVEHVVDAVHLLFDRRGDGLLDGLRVSARIGSGYDDLRRNDVGELRLGQTAHRHQTGKHGNDGDDDGDNRTPNEKTRPWLSAPSPRRLPPRDSRWPLEERIAFRRPPRGRRQLTPWVTTQLPSTCAPTLTGRISTLLSPSTTAT